MIAKGELHLEDKIYPINSLSIEVFQMVDALGRSSSKPTAGLLEIEMDSPEDEVIVDWIVQPLKKLNGSIVLFEADETTKVREINFEDGYCVFFCEKFNESTSLNLSTEIKISSERVKIGNQEVDNQWPKKCT